MVEGEVKSNGSFTEWHMVNWTLLIMGYSFYNRVPNENRGTEYMSYCEKYHMGQDHMVLALPVHDSQELVLIMCKLQEFYSFLACMTFSGAEINTQI